MLLSIFLASSYSDNVQLKAPFQSDIVTWVHRLSMTLLASVLKLLWLSDIRTQVASTLGPETGLSPFGKTSKRRGSFWIRTD